MDRCKVIQASSEQHLITPLLVRASVLSWVLSKPVRCENLTGSRKSKSKSLLQRTWSIFSDPEPPMSARYSYNVATSRNFHVVDLLPIAPPGVLTKYGSFLRDLAANIHFASTESSQYWTGYMDGAIRSGERVAGEIIADF